MADLFISWLDSPVCLADLLPCARRVIKRAERDGISLQDSYLHGAEFHKAVASDLWQFLREEADRLTLKATIFLATNDSEGLARCIVQEFIDSRIDQRRNDSPFHAYYRHMRTVLSEADGINYQALPRKGSYYAWSHAADLTIHPDNLQDYGEWSCCSIAFSELHKKPAMIQLSRHYWDEALKIHLTEYLFSIRGLVAFVASKYPLIPTVEYEGVVDSEDEGNAPHRLLGESLVNPDARQADGAWARQFPQLAQSIIEVDLARIARDCAAQLTSIERAVVCGLDASLTLAEIARSLGMKGPSNVSYHQKLAVEKLRAAWSLWGQPDSEHYAVAEEEQQIFFKKVIKFCKRADARHDSQKEGRP